MRRSLHHFLSVLAYVAGFVISVRRSVQIERGHRSPLGPSRLSKPNPRRGHDAASPSEIPPPGWWAIAKRTAKKFSDNELMSEAAGVTFYALLSLFPAVTAIVSIYGLFADPTTINNHLDMLGGFVPSGGMEIVREQVKRLTASPTGGLSSGAVIGVLTALWSANQGTKAMFSALNDVYGEAEERSFLIKSATTLAFTVGGIACLMIALAAVVVVPLVFESFGASSAADTAVGLARWPLLLIGLIVGLALLYRFGPDRNPARWRWVTWGGAFAAVGWVLLSAGFSWYVEHFGSYNKTYGSLGAVIGFMTWIWLSSTVVLIGAQVNAEMETQVTSDTTVGRDRPRGARGAAAADATSR